MDRLYGVAENLSSCGQLYWVVEPGESNIFGRGMRCLLVSFSGKYNERQEENKTTEK